jgi:hypothetical protein
MSKHTPGPWQWTKGDKYSYPRVGDSADHTIADVWDDSSLAVVSREQGEANAQLIAAAPELLEALKLIYADMERGHSINPYEHKATVLAAIAKAEGN